MVSFFSDARRKCFNDNWFHFHECIPHLCGQAIRAPMFRRFARTDSRESIRRKMRIFEALGQIRANRVFSPIHIEIRVIRVQSSLLSHFLEGRFAKRRFSRSENRFVRIGPLSSPPSRKAFQPEFGATRSLAQVSMQINPTSPTPMLAKNMIPKYVIK